MACMSTTNNKSTNNASTSKDTRLIEIIIIIQKGRALVAKDRNIFQIKKSSDPYVVLKHGDNVFGKTKTIKKKLNPTWNEHFLISKEVPLPYSSSLELEVFDQDILSADDSMGRVTIPFTVSLSPPITKTTKWYPVKPTIDCINAKGDIKVSLITTSKPLTHQKSNDSPKISIPQKKVNSSQGITDLLQLLTLKRFHAAIDHLEINPKNAFTWTQLRPSRSDSNVHTTPTRVLPIHIACLSITPEQPLSLDRLIQKLIEIHPDGLKERDSRGMLPLHIACWKGASLEVVNLMIKTYPEGVNVKDKLQRTPYDWVNRSTNVNRNIIIKALKPKEKGKTSQEDKDPHDKSHKNKRKFRASYSLDTVKNAIETLRSNVKKSDECMSHTELVDKVQELEQKLKDLNQKYISSLVENTVLKKKLRSAEMNSVEKKKYFVSLFETAARKKMIESLSDLNKGVKETEESDTSETAKETIFIQKQISDEAHDISAKAQHNYSCYEISAEDKDLTISNLQGQISSLYRVIGSQSLVLKGIEEEVIDPIKQWRRGVQITYRDPLMEELRCLLAGEIAMDKPVQNHITAAQLDLMCEADAEEWWEDEEKTDEEVDENGWDIEENKEDYLSKVLMASRRWHPERRESDLERSQRMKSYVGATFGTDHGNESVSLLSSSL